jgi:hypothetical protein
MLTELVFDEGRHVNRLDLGQILDADAEGGKLPDRFEVRAAVFLLRMCELKKSRIRFRAWGCAVKM